MRTKSDVAFPHFVARRPWRPPFPGVATRVMMGAGGLGMVTQRGAASVPPGRVRGQLVGIGLVGVWGMTRRRVPARLPSVLRGWRFVMLLSLLSGAALSVLLDGKLRLGRPGTSPSGDGARRLPRSFTLVDP